MIRQQGEPPGGDDRLPAAGRRSVRDAGAASRPAVRLLWGVVTPRRWHQPASADPDGTLWQGHLLVQLRLPDADRCARPVTGNSANRSWRSCQATRQVADQVRVETR